MYYSSFRSKEVASGFYRWGASDKPRLDGKKLTNNYGKDRFKPPSPRFLLALRQYLKRVMEYSMNLRWRATITARPTHPLASARLRSASGKFKYCRGYWMPTNIHMFLLPMWRHCKSSVASRESRVVSRESWVASGLTVSSDKLEAKQRRSPEPGARTRDSQHDGIFMSPFPPTNPSRSIWDKATVSCVRKAQFSRFLA